MLMTVLTLLLAGLACALMILALALASIRHKRIVARLEEISSRLDGASGRPSGRAAELLEVKNFHDELKTELESLLAEAYRAKDKERVQQLQRMGERLETFRARMLDRAIRSLDDAAKSEDANPADKAKRNR